MSTEFESTIDAAQTNSAYRPLDKNKFEIRLLSVISKKDGIKGKLSHFSCHKEYPRYIALSYCWGDPEDTVPITINGQSVKITKILEAAVSSLWELRDASPAKVWIDALCINQSDNSERDHQVSRMAEIYNHSVKTIAWLEPDYFGDARLAFDLLALLSTQSPVEEFEAAVDE